MAWMMDTYSMNQGRTSTGVVTGKPIALGGSLGRHDATGRGVFVAARAAAARLGLPIEGCRVAVQGFGNVGEAAARIFHEAGAKIVAIQDVPATLYNPAGIDPNHLRKHLNEGGRLADCPGATEIMSSDFWGLDCDILVPAAVEGQITAENAPRIRAKMVVEGANGPTTPAADAILHERDVLVVPDVLANAGGVTVSYFEWVQDFSSFFWTEAEINGRLERIMTEAFDAVWHIGAERKLTLRTAAFVVACRRVLEARAVRGLYP
jgi:glutamate dehydrogenase (NAD(P)+)